MPHDLGHDLVRVVIDRDEHGWFVHTTFSDGREVHARPRGESPGELLHDLMHTLLTVYAGVGLSAVLRSVSGDVTGDQRAKQLEESAVLALQAYMDYGTG